LLPAKQDFRVGKVLPSYPEAELGEKLAVLKALKQLWGCRYTMLGARLFLPRYAAEICAKYHDFPGLLPYWGV
jgi:hypothetical protein